MVDRYSDDDDDNQAYEKVGYTFPAIEDNVSSSVPTTVVFDPTKKKLDSQSELELARQEIAELKKQLSQISEREA